MLFIICGEAAEDAVRRRYSERRSGDNDDDAPQWSDAIDRRTTATVSPDRVVATKHAYLLGDGGPSPSKTVRRPPRSRR